MTRALLLTTALLVASPAAPADETHRADQRVAHISSALSALRQTPPEALQQQTDYAHLLARGACSSSVPRLKVECLMTASRRYCRKNTGPDTQRCALDMDVIVSNLLGDVELVSIDKRYQIMTHYKDYRRELARELRRLQGALAVDFRMRSAATTDDDTELARKIDHYCLATTDENNLPWQTCVSSLVWFIGTEREGDQ
jgi:hypothetical protein